MKYLKLFFEQLFFAETQSCNLKNNCQNIFNLILLYDKFISIMIFILKKQSENTLNAYVMKILEEKQLYIQILQTFGVI